MIQRKGATKKVTTSYDIAAISAYINHFFPNRTSFFLAIIYLSLFLWLSLSFPTHSLIYVTQFTTVNFFSVRRHDIERQKCPSILHKFRDFRSMCQHRCSWYIQGTNCQMSYWTGQWPSPSTSRGLSHERFKMAQTAANKYPFRHRMDSIFCGPLMMLPGNTHYPVYPDIC